MRGEAPNPKLQAPENGQIAKRSLASNGRREINRITEGNEGNEEGFRLGLRLGSDTGRLPSGDGGVGEEELELGDAAGDARLHGAERHLENFRDFGIAVVLQIK